MCVCVCQPAVRERREGESAAGTDVAILQKMSVEN